MNDIEVRLRNSVKIAEDRLRNLQATLRSKNDQLEVAQAAARIETDRVQLVEKSLEEFAAKLRRDLNGLLDKPEALWPETVEEIRERIEVDVEAILRRSLAREAKGDVVGYTLVA